MNSDTLEPEKEGSTIFILFEEHVYTHISGSIPWPYWSILHPTSSPLLSRSWNWMDSLVINGIWKFMFMSYKL